MGTRRWYCVQTKPHKDSLVLTHLADLGITVYRPLLEAPRRKGTRVVALFPNYLFARYATVEESVNVRYTPGVRRVLGTGDRPTPIDDAIIEVIRAREGEGGLIRPSTIFRFSERQRVRLRGGGLEGLEALFRRYLPRRQRVEVLMTMLGRQVSIEVPIENVVPAHV